MASFFRRMLKSIDMPGTDAVARPAIQAEEPSVAVVVALDALQVLMENGVVHPTDFARRAHVLDMALDAVPTRFVETKLAPQRRFPVEAMALQALLIRYPPPWLMA